jgi:Spy/CpxP family protein refolding chaperone
MKTRMAIAALAIGSATTLAMAQGAGKHHAQPYAGQQTRIVASLSDDDVKGFLAGSGLGLAKSAEVNGHPGPSHVLELAEELKLTPEQRQLVKAAFDRMKAKAVALGEAYIKAEQAVDEAFKSGSAKAHEVEARVAEANRLLGEVRLSHLIAHVEITPVLTPEQRARYAELRGYTGSSPADGPRKHKH